MFLKNRKFSLIILQLVLILIVTYYYLLSYSGFIESPIFTLLINFIPNILATIIIYFFINDRLDRLEEKIGYDSQKDVKSIKIGNTNFLREIANYLEKKQIIYRINISIGNDDKKSAYFLREIFYIISKTDARVRIIIPSSEVDVINDLQRYSAKYLSPKQYLEIRHIKKNISNTFLIDDTSMWLQINEREDTFESAIVLNVAIDSEICADYKNLFNEKWVEAEAIKVYNPE